MFSNTKALLRLIFMITAFSLPTFMYAYEGHSEEFHNALSLQGFTGILNTPNAALTREGRIYALYSDQKENFLRPRLKREDSYMFSVGFFDLLEMGGRFTEAPSNSNTSGGMRDLSGNFKLQVPFIPKGEYIPRLAVGVQDLGGNLHRLRTVYGVATEEIWRLRISAGAGIGPDRMKGGFGGVEAKAFDWLYLLGEYDTREANVGLRLVTPELFGIPVNLQVTVKSALNKKQGDPEYGFGLQIPLGSDHYNRKPLPKAETVQEKGAAKSQAEGRTAPVAPSQANISSPEADRRQASLLKLRDRLAKDGLQYLRVGEGDGGVLVVEYENGRYSNNELDGMGVVAGIAAEMAPEGFESLRLVLLKKGIKIFQVTAPVSAIKEFMADAAGEAKLREALRATPELTGNAGVHFVAEVVNPGWLRPQLVLYPELKTFIGMENSPADYLLSLRPDLYLPLWKGAVANARWDIPLSWNDGFDDGQPLRGSRTPSQMDRLMLFQAVSLAPTLMANIGAGMIVHDGYGTLNELLWQPGDGTHRFRLRQAFADNSHTHARSEVYLGAYRYRYAPLDLSLEATAGRFWSRDTGFTLELKRFFGDTAFSVYYKDVRSDSSERIHAGGVQFSFPLTLRREMNPSPVQLKGNDEWNYAQETEIASKGLNQVGRAIAINPQPYFNLGTVFYNRDRLTESYLKLHLLRLRDAYIHYGLNE
jgi:hypothetical protein